MMKVVMSMVFSAAANSLDARDWPAFAAYSAEMAVGSLRQSCCSDGCRGRQRWPWPPKIKEHDELRFGVSCQHRIDDHSGFADDVSGQPVRTGLAGPPWPRTSRTLRFSTPPTAHTAIDRSAFPFGFLQTPLFSNRPSVARAAAGSQPVLQ